MKRYLMNKGFIIGISLVFLASGKGFSSDNVGQNIHEEEKIEKYKKGDKSNKEDLIGKVLEGKIEYEINKVNHLAYLEGYKDNTIKPEGNLTREEAAMVFYRLLDIDFRRDIETSENSFDDIESGRWSEEAIGTLEKIGMITGYKDGSFRPEKEITRAEISSIIGKLTDTLILPTEFKDVVDHWAEDYINSIGSKGWIRGYEDGNFRPNGLIKRSELATIVNNILERNIRKTNILPGIKEFDDLNEDKWYYKEIVEATNSHKYIIKNGEDIWVELID